MNYCTLWLDRLLWWDRSQCCAAHDADYSLGMVKPVADYFLQACANHILPGLGDVMWFGLVVLGRLISAWFYAAPADTHNRPSSTAANFARS